MKLSCALIDRYSMNICNVGNFRAMNKTNCSKIRKISFSKIIFEILEKIIELNVAGKYTLMDELYLKRTVQELIEKVI